MSCQALDQGALNTLASFEDSIAGTILYMAPEVLSPSPRVGGGTDVWSYGAMLWHMLTGRQPYAHWGSHVQAYAIMYRVGIKKVPDSFITSTPERNNNHIIDVCARSIYRDIRTRTQLALLWRLPVP